MPDCDPILAIQSLLHTYDAKGWIGLARGWSLSESIITIAPESLNHDQKEKEELPSILPFVHSVSILGRLCHRVFIAPRFLPPQVCRSENTLLGVDEMRRLACSLHTIRADFDHLHPQASHGVIALLSSELTTPALPVRVVLSSYEASTFLRDGFSQHDEEDKDQSVSGIAVAGHSFAAFLAARLVSSLGVFASLCLAIRTGMEEIYLISGAEDEPWVEGGSGFLPTNGRDRKGIHGQTKRKKRISLCQWLGNMSTKRRASGTPGCEH